MAHLRKLLIFVSGFAMAVGILVYFFGGVEYMLTLPAACLAVPLFFCRKKSADNGGRLESFPCKHIMIKAVSGGNAGSLKHFQQSAQIRAYDRMH